MPVDAPVTPILASLFKLDIEGLDTGFFTSISGLEIKTAVVEHKAISNNDGQTRVRKTAGAVTTYGDIKLKRGLIPNNELWDWYQQIMNGDPADQYYKNGSIHFCSDNGTILDTWLFEEGWPSGWNSESAEAGSDKLVMEEITLSVNRIYRETVGPSSR